MTILDRWDFEPPSGPARLLAELASAGIVWCRFPAFLDAADRDPWTAAGLLLGERPDLVERQPIRPIPGGRSFSSGHMAAPFHSDSQTFLGVPPHLQVMACRRAAAAGGENLYLDTWRVLEKIEREAPDLFVRLFEKPRRFPFVFGDLVGPTVSSRGRSLVFTHSAFPDKGDAEAAALQPYLDAAPAIEVRAEPGDTVVIHNHRLLHGRRAFTDTTREFLRLLVWRREGLAAPPAWLERAARADEAGSAAEPGDPLARQRLRVVLELLRGVPAGVLSAREGIPEPVLYAWRDAALLSALGALGEPSSKDEDKDRA